MKPARYYIQQAIAGSSALLLMLGVALAEPLKISVSRTPLSLPFYVAESQGYFAAEGVQIKIEDVIGGHRSMQQMLNAEADLATCSDAVIMFNSFKRSDFAVIASFVSSDNDVKIIVGKDTDLSRPTLWSGKRIATVVGAASHYYLDNWLLFQGVDPRAVHTINYQPEAMEAALAKGEVEAVAIWEPYPFKIIHAVSGSKVLPNPAIYVMTFNLIAHKKLLGVRDDDLLRLLHALDRAEHFIKDEPRKAQAILRSRLQLDQAFIDWIWPHNLYQLSLDQSLLSTLESEARWAKSENHVAQTESPNYLNFTYATPLRKVLPIAVGIAK